MASTQTFQAEETKVSANLARLAALQGTDPGIFVLSVHSFVESWMRDRISLDEDEGDHFADYLWELRQLLAQKHPSIDSSRFDVLSFLHDSHRSTNRVRHEFATLGVGEARLATGHLLKFCDLVGIREREGLRKIEEYLEAWNDRKPLGELARSLAEAGYRLQLEKNKTKQLTLQAEQVGVLERRIAEIKGELAGERHERERLEGGARKREELEGKYDEARARIFKMREELKAANLELAELREAREYLDILSRMTVYTRTRLDYERTITRLTTEQAAVLERISLDEDFLIKGSAGTGKTLVLLKAIEKAGSGVSGQGGLDLPEARSSMALLTYTNTLVKYDQYVASLLMEGSVGGRVCTADAFLAERFREVAPGMTIEYKLPEELARRFPAAGMSPRELAAEIEGFLWGNDIDRDEYLVEGIERRGMKRPLNKEQRAAVWSSAEAMIASMEAEGTWTRNRAALFLARAVAEGRAEALTRTDLVFIDEAQDLPAAVLKALRACARKAVILAGDADQSIYQPGFSFKRAGIEIGGRTRILRTNFRNTVQLHDLAERYRRAAAGSDGENLPEAFRDGPAPELFEGADVEEMLTLLERRVDIFLNVLGYAPENLCVMVPRDEELQQVRARLAGEGVSVADIRDKGFDFRESGSVRVTTMHSAKGLDFPVVLLFVPQFHVISAAFDPAAADRMARNLVYVAMTRAMDHLNVFLRQGSENPAIVDLAECFEAREGEGE